MRLKRWAASIVRQRWTVFWLTVMWVMLWGEVSIANVLGGIAVAVAVMTVMPLPPIAFRGRLRVVYFLRLVGRFAWDLVVASAEVSWLALRWDFTPREAVVGVRLRSRSDIILTMTAELSSLVPGSVVVEAHQLTGMLYLHVLDIDQAGGIEQVRTDVLALEARVIRAIASTRDLERYGVELPGLGGWRRRRRSSDRPDAREERP